MRQHAAGGYPVRDLRPGDLPQLENILRATDAFTGEEVDCAMELLDIVLTDPRQRDYLVTVADDNAGVQGYILYGPTPLACGNVTIYWLAVAPEAQGKGVGRQLMTHVEQYTRRLRGRLICLETSSQGGYERTRNFYRCAGYREEGRLRDFYRPGDDRLTFIKRLVPDEEL
jgi:ribosomal protein S18 acetylase RimI-like enzyme